jgi:hypothetical protein
MREYTEAEAYQLGYAMGYRAAKLLEAASSKEQGASFARATGAMMFAVQSVLDRGDAGRSALARSYAEGVKGGRDASRLAGAPVEA